MFGEQDPRAATVNQANLASIARFEPLHAPPEVHNEAYVLGHRPACVPSGRSGATLGVIEQVNHGSSHTTSRQSIRSFPVSERPKPAASIRRLSLRNYKGIDRVELELPAPRMATDPDVFVIGSENGLGKTSILECCSLLLSALVSSEKQFPLHNMGFSPINIPDLLIRAGSDRLEVNGDLSLHDRMYKMSFCVNRKGDARVAGEDVDSARSAFGMTGEFERVWEDLMSTIAGLSADPVAAESFLFFHSYRRVMEGNPELGMIAEGRPSRPYRYRSRFDFTASRFKMTILKSLMQRADLFELSEVENADRAIDQLNELLEFYAGGQISKLRPDGDNTVEFRIQSHGGGESFTFDGLSSGQKQIISTLFLVWYHTRKRPRVVIIDEPELHLNAQWHRNFVNKLFELAPHNQYIIATQSVEVMDSVEKDRRLILSR